MLPSWPGTPDSGYHTALPYDLDQLFSTPHTPTPDPRDLVRTTLNTTTTQLSTLSTNNTPKLSIPLNIDTADVENTATIKAEHADAKGAPKPRPRPKPIIHVKEVEGFPSRSEPVPPELSCYEVCQQYPNSLYYEVLDPFIQHNWSCNQVYECLPDKAKQAMTANHTTSKNPSNSIAKRMSKRRLRLHKLGQLHSLLTGPTLRPEGREVGFKANGRFPPPSKNRPHENRRASKLEYRAKHKISPVPNAETTIPPTAMMSTFPKNEPNPAQFGFNGRASIISAKHPHIDPNILQDDEDRDMKPPPFEPYEPNTPLNQWLNNLHLNTDNQDHNMQPPPSPPETFEWSRPATHSDAYNYDQLASPPNVRSHNGMTQRFVDSGLAAFFADEYGWDPFPHIDQYEPHEEEEVVDDAPYHQILNGIPHQQPHRTYHASQLEPSIYEQQMRRQNMSTGRALLISYNSFPARIGRRILDMEHNYIERYTRPFGEELEEASAEDSQTRQDAYWENVAQTHGRGQFGGNGNGTSQGDADRFEYGWALENGRWQQ